MLSKDGHSMLCTTPRRAAKPSAKRITEDHREKRIDENHVEKLMPKNGAECGVANMATKRNRKVCDDAEDQDQVRSAGNL